MKIHLAFGYDTQGLLEYGTSHDPSDLLDGFYISDRANADGTGPLEPQMEFYGEISAAAELNLLIAQAGVGGGIFASIDFTLDDPSGTGKVRFSEIAANAKRGALDIFDVSGEVDAYLFAFLRLSIGFVTIYDDTVTIADITLLSFHNDPDSPPPPATQSGGTLTLNTPPGNDRINVLPVLDSSNRPIPGSVYVQAYGQKVQYNNVTEITDTPGGTGSDTITVDARVTIPTELWGGSGNNYLIAGGGPTTLYGGAGVDTLVGGSGLDVLYGGGGNDIISAGTGAATLDGGAGDDQLTGGPGNDLLTGDDGNDTLIGGGGNDTLVAGAGNDILQGDAGNDSLEGGSGNDSIYGGTGNDSIYGGSGNDYIEGDDGNDTITGGTGNDYIDGGANNDSIYGGSGNDTIYGEAGNDTIVAGIGNDYIDGGAGNDSIYGGTGLDTIYGNTGDDYIDGGLGDDTIYGGTGNDTIYGGGGDDFIVGETTETGDGPTTDTKRIYGGVSPNDPADSSPENDTIYGSLGNDTITGGVGNNLIYGLAGDDSIVGLGGDDTIYAGTGNDTAFGGGGDDSIVGGGGNNFFDGGAGDDTLVGGVGNDTLVGESGNDVLYGGDGNDVLWGGSMQFATSAVTVPPGYDPSDGGQDPNSVFDSGYTPPMITPTAADGLSIGGSPTDGNDSLYGGPGNDSLFGGGGNDYIDAGPGDDYADGGAGNDYINGGIGDDVLRGGAGDDTLNGGPGIDQLFGDAGNDQLFGDAGTLGLQGNLVPSKNIVLAQAATFTIDVDGSGLVNISVPPSASPTGYATLDNLIGAINTALTAAYSPSPSPVTARRLGALTDSNGNNNSRIAFVLADGNDQGAIVITNTIVVTQDQLGFLNSPPAGTADARLVGIQQGQRLWGGDGNDILYAYADSSDPSQTLLGGDELHGGNGEDTLYGNIRQDTLFGEAGDDVLYGDYLSGPNYALNPNPATFGGNDTLEGGDGDDSLYGGGGNDVLYGGDGSDYLVGQDGADSLYGGTGIDTLVLDTSASYQDVSNDVFDGYHENDPSHATDPPADLATDDDNATNILEIDGTTGNDTILISQTGAGYAGGAGLLLVNYDGRLITAKWRSNPTADNPTGVPLIQQFEVDGEEGNDRIEFLTTAQAQAMYDTPQSQKLYGFEDKGASAVDVSQLSARSTDWVSVIDGGPGDDTIQGTAGNDLIDGGPGSDVLYGMAGDDQLWGDEENSTTPTDDYDILYGGAGDDDLIGGSGRNQLSAWSFDPSPVQTQFHFADGQSAAIGPDGITYELIGSEEAPPTGRLDDDAIFTLTIGDNAPVSITVTAASTANNTSIFDPADPLDPTTLVGDINLALQAAGLYGTVDAGVSPADPAELALILVGGAKAGPLTIGTGAFGVWVDPNNPGVEYNNIGTNEYVVPGAPSQIIIDTLGDFQLEGTGLNRALGGPGNDDLYGGTDLDFLDGGPGVNVLYNQQGQTFDSLGSAADPAEWQQFALQEQTNEVWYYSGTNQNDIITVDYVTEPGVLAGHHLITRLTDNNGSYSFDAQVQLDFNATNSNGGLVWTPGNTFFGLSLLGSADAPLNGQLGGEATFSLSVDGDAPVAVTVPNDPANTNLDGLIADINAALVDAGLGGIVSAKLVGNAVSLVRVVGGAVPNPSLELLDANSVTVTALHLVSYQQGVQGAVNQSDLNNLLPPEGDFQAIIIDGLGGNDTITIGPTVQKSVWVDGGAGNDTIIDQSGTPILPDKTDPPEDRNDTIEQAYVLTPNSSGQPIPFGGGQLFTGLTLDNPTDQDWYEFSLASTGAPTSVSVTSTSPDDQITLELWGLDAQGNYVQLATTAGATQAIAGMERIDLASLGLTPGTNYWLHLYSNDVTTIYQVKFSVPDLAASSTRAEPFPLVDASGVPPGEATGLSLDSPLATEWFSVPLNHNGTSADSISLTAIDSAGPVTLTVYYANGQVFQTASTGEDPTAIINLAELSEQTLLIKVNGDANIPNFLADYELWTVLDQSNPSIRDLSAPDLAASSTQSQPFPLVDASGVPLGEATGLTLASSQATEWFSVPLNHTGTSADSISLMAIDSAGPVTLTVYNAAGQKLQTTSTGLGSTATVKLQGVTPQTLLIEVSGSGPADYELQTALGQSNPSTMNLAGEINTIDFSAAQTPAYDRRDVLLGGDGNDTITGGPGTDWIFGGDGNDVLSAGSGQHQGDLIWGGAGDDIFQIVPTSLPATLATQGDLNPLAVDYYLPTYSDEFNGGTGDDEVLFLGGDTDNQGRPVPDDVAVRYNTLLGRYEFTARVWDDTNQRWAIDPQTGDDLQYYDFFQVTNVQTFAINTQGGDDVVHADPGYTIDAGYADPSTEWGITEQDIRQGATLGLEIDGGAGDDRLYGSAGNDTIAGGAGDDVIVGGGGDDLLNGGAGDDWITGGSDTPPDVYTFTGPLGTGTNDTPGNASPLDIDLSGLLNGQNVTFPSDPSLDPSLREGDEGEWFSLPTPLADEAFGTLDQALMTSLTDSQLVQLSFLDPAAQALMTYLNTYQEPSGGMRPWVFVYPAQAVTVNGISTYEPVDQYNGVPDEYLIHVVNPNDYAVIANSSPTTFILPGSDVANFSMTVNGVSIPTVEIPSQDTITNSIGGLVNEIQKALNASLAAESIPAGTVTVGVYRSNGVQQLGFWLMSGTSLEVTVSPTDPASTILGFGEPGTPTTSTGMYLLGLSATPAPMGNYQLTFLGSQGLGQTTDISVASADATLTPTGVGSSSNGLSPPVPVNIPLGDITGDGYSDFISSEQDAPYQGYGLATVSFGGANTTAAALAQFFADDPAPGAAAPVFVPRWAVEHHRRGLQWGRHRRHRGRRLSGGPDHGRHDHTGLAGGLHHPGPTRCLRDHRRRYAAGPAHAPDFRLVVQPEPQRPDGLERPARVGRDHHQSRRRIGRDDAGRAGQSAQCQDRGDPGAQRPRRRRPGRRQHPFAPALRPLDPDQHPHAGDQPGRHPARVLRRPDERLEQHDQRGAIGRRGDQPPGRRRRPCHQRGQRRRCQRGDQPGDQQAGRGHPDRRPEGRLGERGGLPRPGERHLERVERPGEQPGHGRRRERQWSPGPRRLAIQHDGHAGHEFQRPAIDPLARHDRPRKRPRP